MKIAVASKNPIKINAVKWVVEKYKFLNDFSVCPVEVNTGVSEQPKSLEETVRGAINRAENVFTSDYKYSVGIESGIMKVPYTVTGHMDFCACSIYDGQRNHLGLSPAFEFPTEITRLINEEGISASQAYLRIGLTNDKNLNAKEGIIGIVSDGHVTRFDYTVSAIKMALLQLQHPELYLPK